MSVERPLLIVLCKTLRENYFVTDHDHQKGHCQGMSYYWISYNCLYTLLLTFPLLLICRRQLLKRSRYPRRRLLPLRKRRLPRKRPQLPRKRRLPRRRLLPKRAWSKRSIKESTISVPYQMWTIGKGFALVVVAFSCLISSLISNREIYHHIISNMNCS
jgi:hypothetical protein